MKIVIAFGICGAAFFGYMLLYGVIVSKSAAVADLETQITIATETASRIASARSTLAKIIGDEIDVQQYFVSQTGVVAFINSLEQYGHLQKADIKVLSVSTSGTPKEPTLVFELSVEGTFDAVMRTIGTIEYAPYALSISRLSLGSNPQKSWHADLTLHVGSIPLEKTTNPNGLSIPTKTAP